MGCGKLHIQFIEPDDDIAQGFVLDENNNGKLLVETRNRVSLIVSPPTLEKYTDDNDKERFRWIFEEDKYQNKTFIVKHYHPIQMHIKKYNNLKYLTNVVPRYVYKRVSAQETEIEESLCS